MRIVVTLLAVAGNFGATVALMLSLSVATNVGLTTSANAQVSCDPRHYFCFPCKPRANQPACNRNCCNGVLGTKPE